MVKKIVERIMKEKRMGGMIIIPFERNPFDMYLVSKSTYQHLMYFREGENEQKKLH